MNALGGGLRIAWALEEAQLVLFPPHLGYRTPRSFRPPTHSFSRVTLWLSTILFDGGTCGSIVDRQSGYVSH